MEEREQEMSGEESLRLITEMVQTAKTGIRDNGFFYLFWGWLVFVASLSQYALMVILHSPYNDLPWAVLMPLGGIVSVVYGRKKKKAMRVRTYLDQFMGYALIAFLISLFTILFFMFQTRQPHLAYPLIMMVYGAWLFISGGALQFRPLLIGGCINWILSLVSMFVSFEWQLLILALAVLLGYIIPGHLLKANYNKQ
ncbi:MAG TPA: hypothetical protein VGO45_12225 [Bacteroidia bacterium]|jgi:hypothetical protein|nr:hypothetical protein [Bacteroidia bacterium]